MVKEEDFFVLVFGHDKTESLKISTMLDDFNRFQGGLE